MFRAYLLEWYNSLKSGYLNAEPCCIVNFYKFVSKKALTFKEEINCNTLLINDKCITRACAEQTQSLLKRKPRLN